MNAQPWYRRMLNGQAGGWTLPLRGALRVASAGYGLAVQRRNRLYDDPRAQRRVPIPVISVGNITVGGTGKTPMVIELLGRLHDLGAAPAVVARGYRRTDESRNDEQLLIQRRCPFVVCVTNRDRVSGAEQAQRLGADIVVLDDGFQHRRLARDLDIALVDATCPFGYGSLLPRGLLREPPSSLRRAHAVVLTRCDLAAAEEVAATARRLQELAPDALHLQCRHRVRDLQTLDGKAVPPLAGRRVALFAGIANPAAFAAAVSALGAAVVGQRWFPDHHRYTARDISLLTRADRFPQHDALLTTEKDAVKLAHLPSLDRRNILAVGIDLEFLGDGGDRIQGLLERTLSLRSVK